MVGVTNGDKDRQAQVIFQELAPLCEALRFSAGETVREAGKYYRDMYLITGGEVTVALDRVSKATIIVGTGQPIGEIGFLRGTAANATAIAQTDVSAFKIDDHCLYRVEHQQPELYVRLLQMLGQVIDERISQNLSLAADAGNEGSPDDIDVVLCRNEDMLFQAKRLRYDVYCGELGRDSPAASHEDRTLSDEMDSFGNTFLAMDSDEVIGTLRVNLTKEGAVDALEQLYGMDKSDVYPQAVAVCTKLIVKRSHRRSAASMKLVAAAMKFGLQNGVRECFIDCIPPLIHYYRAMGFKLTGQKFLHVENGPSYPMKLDTIKHGARLTGDLTKISLAIIFLKSTVIKFAYRYFLTDAQTGKR